MFAAGQVIGNYTVIRKLGEGGMGAVFEALHQQIGRRVAIKILHPQFAHDPKVAQRFRNEARAVNLVDHPGLVENYDLGHFPDGTAYIVMQLLSGETLTQRLGRRGPLPLVEALQLVRQIARVLGVVHERGVIHRDLKPDNIMLIPDPSSARSEQIKILDFGLAKFVAGGAGQRADDQRSSVALTKAGMVMGTPSYMAPEQCLSADQVSDRADVYSLGIILFQLLTGRVPFAADSGRAVMALHIYEAAPALRSFGAQMDDEVEALLQRLLAKDPAARMSMQELVDAIAGLQLGRSLEETIVEGALPRISYDQLGLERTRVLVRPQLDGPSARRARPAATPPRASLGWRMARLFVLFASTLGGLVHAQPPVVVSPEAARITIPSEREALDLAAGFVGPDSAAQSTAEPSAQRKSKVPVKRQRCRVAAPCLL